MINKEEIIKRYLQGKKASSPLYVVIDYDVFEVFSFPSNWELKEILSSPKDPFPLSDITHYPQTYRDTLKRLQLFVKYGHNWYSDAASDQIYDYLWERSQIEGRKVKTEKGEIGFLMGPFKGETFEELVRSLFKKELTAQSSTIPRIFKKEFDNRYGWPARMEISIFPKKAYYIMSFDISLEDDITFHSRKRLFKHVKYDVSNFVKKEILDVWGAGLGHDSLHINEKDLYVEENLQLSGQLKFIKYVYLEEATLTF